MGFGYSRCYAGKGMMLAAYDGYDYKRFLDMGKADAAMAAGDVAMGLATQDSVTAVSGAVQLGLEVPGLIDSFGESTKTDKPIPEQESTGIDPLSYDLPDIADPKGFKQMVFGLVL